MARNKMAAGIIRLFLIIIVVIAVVVIMRMMIRVKIFQYNTVDAALKNPIMGFAPNADYFDAVGDNTLVYVDVTWRELEPEEGVFDFNSIDEENFLDVWRTQGKNVVFRFVCDEPDDEEHMDIPDWLYEKTGDGVFYDTSYGKGYSPDYTNETFIEYHSRAVKALGERYGRDSFFCYIELGSVGHWGEWHVKYSDGIKRLPSEDVLREYVKPYISAFPKAKLLMRRPFLYVSEYSMGVFNDMTGHAEDTKKWLSWIEHGGTYSEPETPVKLSPVPDIWEKEPVGGEFTSAYSLDEMLTDRLDETLQLLSESHMTFIGPMCPIADREEEKYPDEVYQVLGTLGYRYGVSKCRIADNRFKGCTTVTLTVNNYGTAPMYFDWPFCVYLMDDGGEIAGRHESSLKLTEIAGGRSAEVSLTIAGEERKMLLDGTHFLAAGIEDPDTGRPRVKLDMDADSTDCRYILCRFKGGEF